MHLWHQSILLMMIISPLMVKSEYEHSKHVMDQNAKCNSCNMYTYFQNSFSNMCQKEKFFSKENNCNFVKSEQRYVFVTEWFDNVSGSVKTFNLTFYPRDSSVEMFCLRSKRIFLKRIPVDIDERDFYVGNTVVVLSRQLKIVDYADAKTKEKISIKRQKTFAMVKPDAVQNLGGIIQKIEANGFEVSRMKMVKLLRSQAAEFYIEHQGRSFYEGLLDYMTSGPVVALELVTNNAVEKWRQNLGPTDSNIARSDAPQSIRALYGKDKQSNAAHGSDSDISARRELEFFFPSSSIKKSLAPRTTANFVNVTCCIIKPHAIAEGNLGNILTAIILEGFEISAAEMFRIGRNQAEEFLEVYKNVVDEYSGMVQQLIAGPCVVLEISSSYGAETPSKFREFVGPSDPDIGKELRPKSLRARFGTDKYRNALHCSDLPEDGSLESEYFFKILQ